MNHGFRRLDLFVTEACNLACGYCYTRGQQRQQRLDPSCGQAAVDWLMAGGHRRPHITFWGGEPLLERRLVKALIQRGRKLAGKDGRRLSLSMPTNATLLDSETLGWLVRHGVKMFLSIDGDEQTQAERVMANGASSYPLVRQALERATKLDPERIPAVRMTVTPKNAARLGGNVAFFAALGVRELLIYPTYDSAWSSEAKQTLARAEGELAEQLIDWIRSCADPREVVRLKSWLPILRKLYFGAAPRKPDASLNHCGAGTELVAVNVDGSLSACHRFTFYDRKQGGALQLGSLDQGVDREVQRAFADLTLRQQRGATRCTRCELFDLCSLGCIAINFATTGSLTQVGEAACELMYARVQACRAVHEALASNPIYPIYLGRSPDAALRSVAKKISRRAWQQYSGEEHMRSQA